jgi:hypothetical protein
LFAPSSLSSLPSSDNLFYGKKRHKKTIIGTPSAPALSLCGGSFLARRAALSHGYPVKCGGAMPDVES